MTYPKNKVNPMIINAVTDTNVKVVGEAPALAMGSLYQSAGHSISISSQNAVSNQQDVNLLMQAVTSKCVDLINPPKK
jgi:hypothetical protein